ncbi:hypothetical protein GDO78_017594 [Eleutherodactylus coqui]|uniref:Taste receptor type 2 n=1 Tax=Eleutherodactylus coqui TaxID=57060 RepID=A0A8J6ECP9_ELECQ|nr:hypothetical protein GDO78_017594 [Eleutherodactylus coqui]
MFIVIIHLKSWKNSPPLQAIDIIVTSLAILRTILIALYIFLIGDILCHESMIQMDMFPEHIILLTLSVEFCNMWWSSVLCVFYCVKITHSSNRLLTRLKMNISKMIPWLLLVSVVPSFFSSLPYKWLMFSIHFFNVTNGQTRVIETNWFNYFIIRFVASIIPFIIFCFSVGLLIASLLRHTRHMSSSGSGFTEAQRDIHISVIRSMIVFLLCYVLYFLASNLFPVGIIYKRPLLTPLCAIFYVAVPSLHSFSIIVGNSELKNAILIILHCSWMRAKSLSR